MAETHTGTVESQGIGRDTEHGKESATKHVGLEGSCAGNIETEIKRGDEVGKLGSYEVGKRIKIRRLENGKMRNSGGP